MNREHPLTWLIACLVPVMAASLGDFGPFVPNASCTVPLWLALTLKAQGKATILPPDWMRPEALQETLAQESESEGVLCALPFHWLEVSHLLLHKAAEDIESAELVRRLLKEIEEMRLEKLRSGRNSMLVQARGDASPAVIKLTNISAVEVARLRAQFFPALNVLAKQSELQDQLDARGPAGSGSGADMGGTSSLLQQLASSRGRAASAGPTTPGHATPESSAMRASTPVQRAGADHSAGLLSPGGPDTGRHTASPDVSPDGVPGDASATLDALTNLTQLLEGADVSVPDEAGDHSFEPEQ